MADKLVATLDKAGVRKISTDLWGVFFEDISYSGDGGLNSELVQNGAFEYNRADKPEWSNYTAWRKIVPAGSFAAFGVGETAPVAEENPHYAIAEIGKVGGEQTADSTVSRADPATGYHFFQNDGSFTLQPLPYNKSLCILLNVPVR